MKDQSEEKQRVISILDTAMNDWPTETGSYTDYAN